MTLQGSHLESRSRILKSFLRKWDKEIVPLYSTKLTSKRTASTYGEVV